MAAQPTQMATSDFNLKKIGTKDLTRHLEATINMGGNIAIFGRRGTGKTEIAKHEIAAAGMKEVYLNLSVMERVDLGGYPNVFAAAQHQKFIDFLMPAMYQHMMEGSQKVVALLDEVDKVDPSVWAPLLEFTQFQSVNGKKLPNLHSVIMTGNLIAEGGNRPSLPLLDRTEKYLVEADATSWLDWAGKSGCIHPSITSYISDNPIHLFGSVDPQDRYADPSPRGWTRASDILYRGEKAGYDPGLLNVKVAGCIGKDVGIKYSSYYEHYKQLLPMIDMVFEGKDVADQYAPLEPSKKLVAGMIVCARLATHLDKSDPADELPKAVEHVGKFLKNMSDENILVSVRSQVQIERIVKFNLDERPYWDEMFDKINQQMEG